MRLPGFEQRLARRLDEQAIPSNYLATQLGTHSSTITYWLQGKSRPTLAQFVRLCNLLGLSPTELLAWDHPGTPPLGPPPPRPCSRPGCEQFAKPSLRGGGRLAYYCSNVCRRAHWRDRQPV